MTLTEQQISNVKKQMQQAGRFTPNQVEEWMAQISNSSSLSWGTAAIRLIWREQDSGRVRRDGGEYYMWVDLKS